MPKGKGHAAGQHGKGRLFQRGNRWWVQYYANGQQVRESSHSPRKGVAEKLLMRRLVAAEDGAAPVRQRSISYEEMRKALVTQRSISNRANPSVWEAGLKHLDVFFAETKSSVIDEERIKEFIVARQATGASNATINRALAALRQMFLLSAKKIKDPPDFSQVMLAEPPPRKGFLERAEYQQLLVTLPEYVLPIFTFGYKTGMRLGELKNLTWKNVDRDRGMITLDAEQTKNREQRKIPFGPVRELADIIEQAWQGTLDASGLVFTRAKGRPLGSFRKAWIRACIKAGQGRMLWECPACHKKVEVAKQPWPPEVKPDEVPRCSCGMTCRWKYTGRIFHDLRRTALRNLRRSGVPESVVMTISGHKSRDVFERYNIKSEKDGIEAMERLEVFQQTEDAKLAPRAARPN